jgi:long-chain acyl-CoA synthetase
LISDRKKDLVKLQLGEYVSLGKVETELKTCPVVENICVYGDPTKQYTVALVVPNPSQLVSLGSRLGLNSLNFEQLCANQTVEKAVLNEIGEHGKKCKFLFFALLKPTCEAVWNVLQCKL